MYYQRRHRESLCLPLDSRRFAFGTMFSEDRSGRTARCLKLYSHLLIWRTLPFPSSHSWYNREADATMRRKSNQSERVRFDCVPSRSFGASQARLCSGWRGCAQAVALTPCRLHFHRRPPQDPPGLASGPPATHLRSR